MADISTIRAQIDELARQPLASTLYVLTEWSCVCGHQVWHRFDDDPDEPRFKHCVNCGRSADKLFLREATR